MKASDQTEVVTQINRDGSTTLFCNGNMRLVDSLPPLQHVESLNQLRNNNRKNEVDKFVARIRKYNGSVPDSLIQLGY